MRLHFQFRRYRLPFRSPVRTAHGVWKERAGLIVRLEAIAETGNRKPESSSEPPRSGVGFGEAAPIPWFGTETVDEDEAGARAIGEWIEDAALEAMPARLACLRNAVAAARAELGQPETGNRRPETGNRKQETADRKPEIGDRKPEIGDRKPETGNRRPETGDRKPESGKALGVAALLPAGRAALTQILPRVELGFRVFKWKVGVGDPADEIALLDDVCAALPSGAKLRLDANGAWDRRRAERWLERCADRPVEFVEQPCFAEASQGATVQRKMEDVLRGLAEDYPTPIALDESLVRDGDVTRWIGDGWRGVFVVKPALLADVGAAMASLSKAKAAVVFSSALETSVGARAALRAAFAWTGEARALGFGVWPLFADGRFDGPVAMPFVRAEDVERLNPEAVWNALS